MKILITGACGFIGFNLSKEILETKKCKINPVLLLLTQTEHDRFDFYDGSLRKES